MITFLIKGNRAVTTPNFSLKDLPGSGGRIDVLCRCLTSALLLSHDIRRNVEVILCLEGPPNEPVSIRVMGRGVKHLCPDERSTAILFQKALKAVKKGEEVESTPGIFVSNTSFLQWLEKLWERVIVLDEKGETLTAIPVKEPCFVIGDHLGFSENEEKILSKANNKVNVSPKTLHASHCIVLILNKIDEMNAC
ncbi:MAG: tRNA (pseudouridine(54)-N(1))-methyltransferase TrmY [Candidatus Methanofastidiosia archaeon]